MYITAMLISAFELTSLYESGNPKLASALRIHIVSADGAVMVHVRLDAAAQAGQALVRLVAAGMRITAVSELDPALLAKAFIRSEASLQKAFDEALAKAGPGATVAILPDGTVTVPKIGAR